MKALGLLCAALLAIQSGAASAAIISGVGDADNAPQLAGGVVVDFETTAAGLYPSVTIGNVTFTGVGSSLNVGPDFAGSFNTRGTQSLFTDFDLDPDQIRIDFGSAVSGFAFNWGASDNSWLMQVFDASNSLLDSLLIAPVFSSNAGDYFGSLSSNIAYILLTDQFDNDSTGDYVFIDNLTYLSDAPPIPIPGAAMLLLTGVLGLGAAAKRRRGTA